MKKDRLLIIFFKNPVEGKVKSRLAADLGDKKALAVFTGLYRAVLRASLPVDADKQIYYSGEIIKDDDWPEGVFQKHVQAGGDIGRRMKHAMEKAFVQGYSRVCLIGTDIHQLTTSILDEAFHLLTHNKAVIGPARDGGYYLIGLTGMVPGIFENMPWSTPRVFGETISKLSNAGLRFALLPQLYDIDTLDDLKDAGLYRK